MHDKSLFKAIWGNDVLLKTAQTWILRLLIVFSAFMPVFQMLGASGFVSLLFHGSFLLVAALWLTTLPRLYANDWIALAAIVVAFVGVCVNGVLSGAEFSFGYLKKFIFFAATMILFAAAQRIRADKKTEQLLRVSIYAVTVVMVLAFVFGGTKMYEINGVVSRYLTFGFGNPNFAAIMILCFLCFLGAFFVSAKGKGEKIFCVCLFAVLVFFLLKTKSRNALLVFMAYIVLAIVAWFYLKKRNRLSRWLALLIAVWPLIFAGLYFAVLTSDWFVNALSFMVEDGKNLDSRVDIWQYAFDTIRDWPVFGGYYQVTVGAELGHMHNTHVNTLASHGPVVLVLLCALLYRLLRGCCLKNYGCTLYLVGFVCVLLLGMGESALFSGGLSFYIFAGLFLILARSGEEETEKTA